MIRCRLVYVARGGYSTVFHTGEAPPRGHGIIYTICYIPGIFDSSQGTPFVYILLTNDAPFTYLIYKFASGPFNCYK